MPPYAPLVDYDDDSSYPSTTPRDIEPDVIMDVDSELGADPFNGGVPGQSKIQRISSPVPKKCCYEEKRSG